MNLDFCIDGVVDWIPGCSGHATCCHTDTGDVYSFGGFTREGSVNRLKVLKRSGCDWIRCLPEKTSRSSNTPQFLALHDFYFPSPRSLREQEEEFWPRARYDHSIVSHGDQLILYGGDIGTGHLSDLWVFSVSNTSWVQLKPYWFTESTETDSLVSEQDPPYSQTYLSKSGIRLRAPHSPSRLEHWPCHRSGHSSNICVSVSQSPKMIVFGGVRGKEGFNDIWELTGFDANCPSWTCLSGSPITTCISEKDEGETDPETLKVYPKKRHWHVSGLGPPNDRMLYVFGGMDFLEHSCLGQTWAFSLMSNLWSHVETVGQMPPNRCRHSGVVVGSELIICGGRNWQGNSFNDIWSLNLQTHRWRRLSLELPEPVSSHSVSFLPLQNELIITGGVGRTFSELEETIIIKRRVSISETLKLPSSICSLVHEFL